MQLEAQRLRLVRVLLVAVLVLLAAPAVAQGAGPERPPVKAPSKLGPEPAPAARVVTPPPPPPPSTVVTQTSSSSSQGTTTTPSRPVVATPTSAPPQQRPATSARPKPRAQQAPPPKPKATHAVKAAVRSIAHRLERPGAGIALAAVPTSASDSNRLLFLGGLALLVFVLGDAAFLAISARVIQDES